jgi:hypothetical protein
MSHMIDFSTPLAGLDRATASLNQTAAKIANPGNAADSVDLSSEVVALLQARNDFSANAKALKTEDQITKNLLDTLG